MAGSYISGRLAGKRTPQQSIRLGFALTAAASALNIALNLNGSPGLPWAVLALPLFTCGLGVIMPGLQLLALRSVSGSPRHGFQLPGHEYTPASMPWSPA